MTWWFEIGPGGKSGSQDLSWELDGEQVFSGNGRGRGIALLFCGSWIRSSLKIILFKSQWLTDILAKYFKNKYLPTYLSKTHQYTLTVNTHRHTWPGHSAQLGQWASSGLVGRLKAETFLCRDSQWQPVAIKHHDQEHIMVVNDNGALGYFWRLKYFYVNNNPSP